MTGKDVIAKLKADGWQLNRINGSHYILTKDGLAVPVPVHGSRDIGAVYSPQSSGKRASSSSEAPSWKFAIQRLLISKRTGAFS
ncbi:MAG: type II toxin-antitoxin system HicA family toxin [Casimicrobium sp.]